jgi:hypothetical protein
MDRAAVSSTTSVRVDDTPRDVKAAGKPEVRTVGVLCGGFTEDKLRKAGCAEVYPGSRGVV